ncbi:MAG: hypothetical protein SNG02_00550 [Rikenellaceae bacterium]
MLTALFDLLDFLRSNFSMLFALAFYAILAVALSKSIKKHYKVYYWVFGLLSAGFVIPVICRLCGIDFTLNLGMIPFFGPCISELSSAGNFVHPVLIIIMYMGAFSPKNQYIGRLMSIRKELSIIVGFPVIAHAMKRLFGTFVGGWNFFFDHETAIQSPRVTSVLGSGISSFVYVLGLVMFVLFLVLWITSFDSVHRKLGTQKWKAVQKWSYGLYAMLFIHAMGLNLGGYISDKARAEQMAARAAAQTEMVAEARPERQPRTEGESQEGQRPERPARAEGESQEGQRPERQPRTEGESQEGQRPERPARAEGESQEASQGGHGPQQQQGPQASQGGQQQGQPQAQASQGGHGHGRPSFKFAEIEIDRTNKRLVNMLILVLIYGSYLYFRLRKSRQDKAKRKP